MIGGLPASAYAALLQLQQLREVNPEPFLEIEIDKLHNSGFERLTDKAHASLSRRHAPFSYVARFTARYYVRPIIIAALYLWHHVIDGEITGWKFSSAILACVTISHQDVFAGKGDFPLVNLAYELIESYDGGNTEGLFHGSNDAVRMLDDFDFSVEQEHHGPLPRNQANELVACVEYYNSLHGRHFLATSLMNGLSQTAFYGFGFIKAMKQVSRANHREAAG